MNIWRKSVILIFLLISSACILSAQDKPVITVMDFSTEDVSKSDMRAIISRLSSALFQTDVYTVIDISQRETLLEELKFSLSGCVDDSCALEVGKLLSAENIVVGNISLVGSNFSLSVKTLVTETGKTLFTADGIYPDLEALMNDLNNIALQLSGLSENDILRLTKKPDAREIWSWSTLGAGVVLTAAGLIFFLSGYDMLSDAEDAYDAYMAIGSTGTAAEINAAWDAYMTAYNKANDNYANAQVIGGLITLGVGVVCSGVSAWLFLAEPASDKKNVSMSVKNIYGNPTLLVDFRL